MTQTPTDALRLVPDEEQIFAWLNRKYVQRADERQRSMNLQYMEAETHDLSASLHRWLLAAAPASPLPGGGECSGISGELIGWQDISTFKGTEENYVLIGGPDGLVCEARLLDDGRGWWSRGNDPTDHWGEELFPTHWQPLPAAPTGEPK